MEKIATLFDRDWDGHRGVVPEWSADAATTLLASAQTLAATEKLDGTNVRLTVRAGEVVRVEKRRNPSKDQKKRGITEPWYVDATDGPEDHAIRAAAENVDLTNVPHGEWSGEAIGPKIQGNPLGLDEHRVVLFSTGQAPLLRGCPSLYENGPGRAFDALREYLASTRSALNPDAPIEGVVWHGPSGFLKIKAKDFKS